MHLPLINLLKLSPPCNLLALSPHPLSLPLQIPPPTLNSLQSPSISSFNNKNSRFQYSPMASKWFSSKSFKLRLRKKTPSPPSASSTTTTTTSSSYMEAFRRFDTDGDGKISSTELRAFLAWAGDSVAEGDLECVMRDYDSDGDGLMDYGDFLRLMEMEEGEEDLRRAFEAFESEKGSGTITPRGLQQVLGRLGEERTQEECAGMIRFYDLDGNGVLDYHEFQRMMTMA